MSDLLIRHTVPTDFHEIKRWIHKPLSSPSIKDCGMSTTPWSRSIEVNWLVSAQVKISF